MCRRAAGLPRLRAVRWHSAWPLHPSSSLHLASTSLDLPSHFPSPFRWVPGGHVTSFLLHHRSFRQAIIDSLDKLAQPPLLATATAAQ